MAESNTKYNIRSNRLMRETIKKKCIHYSKLTFECAAGAMFWSAVIGIVYANALYQNLYNIPTHDK